MNNSDREFLAEIKRHVLCWDYLSNSQQNYDALCRLADSTQANSTWLHLSKKTIKQKPEFGEQSIYTVARNIARSAVNVYANASGKRTSREIREVSEKAAFHATELIRLILSNDTLRFMGQDLMPSVERAALSRISRAISSIAVANLKNHPGHYFPPEIERKLDELQARDFPDHANMTSSEAYHILTWPRDDIFLGRLEAFEKLAQKSATHPPRVPRPNKPMADEHSFALDLCLQLSYAYDSPCYEIAAEFCSAVFENVIETDTIKKWWHRRSDALRDTS